MYNRGVVLCDYREGMENMQQKKTRLRYWRLQRFLTQKELAEKAKVAEITISNIERGTPPRMSTAKALARALEIQPQDLYTTEDDEEADAVSVSRRKIAC